MAQLALVVDDSMLIRHTVCRFLEERGFSVESASNGVEALQVLARIQPDLIVTDMNMPRMGGRATFERIKEMFPQMRVLVCSGYSATMLDDGKFTQSIDGFLQKPEPLPDVAQIVFALLGRSA